MSVPPQIDARKSLAGWYVISLRPSGTHAGIRREAAARGARCVACSPIRLRALPVDPAALGAALAAPLRIFTSPASVRFAAALQSLREASGQRSLAVGAGTAAALRRAGARAVDFPQRMDAEGLLALPALQSVRGVVVGLVTAPGGRGVIAPALTDRGASLRIAHVYERQARSIPPARQRLLRALPSPAALLVSSGEALDAFLGGLGPGLQERMRGLCAVAGSPRLGRRLEALGFAQVLVAGSARPADLLSRLAEHAGRTPFL